MSKILKTPFIGDFQNTIRVRTTSSYAFAHAVTAFFGQVTTIHPVYGISNTSNLDQKMTYLFGNGISNSLLKFTIREVKVKLVFDNLNGIAIKINVIPVSTYGSAGIGANSIIVLDVHQYCKSLVLAKAAVTGSVRTMNLKFVPWKIEGFNDYNSYKSQIQFWQNIGSVGTQYSSFYVQGHTSDLTSSPASGVNCVATMDFILDAIQPNLVQIN